MISALRRIWSITPLISAVILCLLFAASGILLFSDSLNPYLEFPPRTIHIAHAHFSYSVFLLYLAACLAIVLFLTYLNRGFRLPLNSHRFASTFPVWGYLGLILLLFGWFCAWTRFEAFSTLQHHTFLPLWYGFIISANALLHARTDSSALTLRPLYFVLLFPISSVFWWFFEFLNRTVQNWYYLGVEHYSSSQYVLLATISFATVLPAIEVVFLLLDDLLSKEAFSRRLPIAALRRRRLPLVLLSISLSGLFFLGLTPDTLFPLLWVAPALVLLSLERLLGMPSLLDELASGRWRQVVLWGLSALVCGFFWEMWNFFSLAKWVYLIPYVQTLPLFEMPLLGYAGYLPFGLFCGAVILEIRSFFGFGPEAPA